jgi:hypothetical protein
MYVLHVLLFVHSRAIERIEAAVGRRLLESPHSNVLAVLHFEHGAYPSRSVGGEKTSTSAVSGSGFRSCRSSSARHVDVPARPEVLARDYVLPAIAKVGQELTGERDVGGDERSVVGRALDPEPIVEGQLA